MTFKDKINKLNVDTLTTEELYALWGTSEAAENEKTDKLIRQMQFKARAELGRMRNERMLQVKRALADKTSPLGLQIRASLANRCPAMFRNLEELSDEQLERIAKDMEILAILEKENEQSN